MRFRASLLAAVFAFAAVQGSGPPVPSLRVVDDFAALQGDWGLIAMESAGKMIADVSGTWTFKGDRLTWTTEFNQKREIVTCPGCQFRLDTSRRPAWLTCWNGPVRTNSAIYHVQGNTLQICSGVQGFRPQSFDTQGVKATLYTFKRVPPAPTRLPDRSAVTEP